MEYVNTNYELIYTNYELGIDFYWNLIINVIKIWLIMLVMVEIWLDIIDNCILIRVEKTEYNGYFTSIFVDFHCLNILQW